MYLIKVCPSCKTKLRFPIDKGTIRVKCSCGFDFIADPDDTEMYNNASFDLSRTTFGLKKLNSFRRAVSGFQFGAVGPYSINKLLNAKYKIQNVKLLPDSEKKRIILIIIAVMAIIAGLIALFYFSPFIFGPKKIII